MTKEELKEQIAIAQTELKALSDRRPRNHTELQELRLAVDSIAIRIQGYQLQIQLFQLEEQTI